MSDEEQNLPMSMVMVGVVLVVAAFFWCCAASGYATEVEGRSLGYTGGPRRMGAAALAFFLSNGVIQLSNLTSVISYTFEQQWWVIIGVIVTEVIVLLGFGGMKIVERNLEGPRHRKRR